MPAITSSVITYNAPDLLSNDLIPSGLYISKNLKIKKARSNK
jgi:hypothetical protein